MSDKPFNEQAAKLIDTALDLIKQVLVKHSAAVLEEMRDQIVKRNQRIKQLEDELEWDKTEKSNYSKILTALGMEEEGDPVKGLKRLNGSVATLERKKSVALDCELRRAVTLLGECRCYIDSPTFDEEGETTSRVDEFLVAYGAGGQNPVVLPTKPPAP